MPRAKPYSVNTPAGEAFASTGALKEQVSKIITAPIHTEEPQDAGDGLGPKDHEEFVFDFSHKVKRGKVYEGSFTNRILTTGENQQVAALKARFAAGMSVESMEPTVRALNEAIAHMSFSFWSKDGQTFRGPDWARDLRELIDQDAIFALWEEVWAHESHFFRLVDPTSESPKEP